MPEAQSAETPSWQLIAHQARLHRDDSIAQVQPPVPNVPTSLPKDVTPLPKYLLLPEEVQITETSTEELLALIAKGELTSTEVTRAFLRRAGLAQKLVYILPLLSAFCSRLSINRGI